MRWKICNNDDRMYRHTVTLQCRELKFYENSTHNKHNRTNMIPLASSRRYESETHFLELAKAFPQRIIIGSTFIGLDIDFLFVDTGIFFNFVELLL